MKFHDLPSDAREQAVIALGQLIVARAELGMDVFEHYGRCVAAAFIAMERHDSAPEKRDDWAVKIGDSSSAQKE